MSEVKAHNYPEVYEALGYNLSKLGCLMIDTEPIVTTYWEIMQDGVTAYFPEYKSKNKDRFWIDGYVASKTPHLTLFYGFLQEAKCYKWHIEKILGSVPVERVVIEDVSFFDSPYPDEEYYCVVAKVEKTKELVDAHNKMLLLPNIQTFPVYTPHITVAYIVKDEGVRDRFIEHLKKEIVGKSLKTVGLNYGGN